MNIGAGILRSRAFQWTASSLVAAYVRLCWATTRWQIEGREDLEARLGEGPVILCLWHEHLMFSPVAWGRGHPMCTIAQDAHAGRLAGEVMKRLGLMNRHLDSSVTNLAITREVMALARGGVSIGLAVDGPTGPRRQASEVAITWARGTGLPLWGFSYSVTRCHRLSSWDKLVFPSPFARGKLVFEPLRIDVPRKLAPMAAETLRAELGTALNGIEPESR